MKASLVLTALVVLAIGARESRGGEITVSPTMIDFGPVSVSGPPANNAVLLSNTGSTTMVNGLVGSGPSCGNFGVVGSFPVFLANGQNMVLPVQFDPATRGNFSCQYTVQDADPNADTFQLFGVGTAPMVAILTPPFPQALVFADQPWDGGIAETLSVEIQNTGNEDITAGHLFANFTSGVDFTAGLPTFPIAKGAHAVVPVYFDPTSEGVKNDVLVIGLDNDLPADPTPTLNVTGTGTSPKVGIDPATRPVALRLVGPNPVDDRTRFAYEVPVAGRVKLGLYAMNGRLVLSLVDRVEDAGRHEWAWSTRVRGALPSGMYIVRLSLEGRALATARLAFLR